MIDLAPLLSPVTSAGSRQLSEIDPTLDRMISLAEKNQYVASAEQAMALWQQQIYDVRTLGFYLFGAFAEQGLIALPNILECIDTALTQSWEYLGPAEHKPRHMDSALRWFFFSLVGHLRFHQRRQGEEWRSWLAAWEQMPQARVLARLEQLAQRIQSLQESPSCTGQLFSLKALLIGLPATVRTPAEPATETEPPAAAVEGEQQLLQLPELVSPTAPSNASEHGTPRMLTIPLSAPMQQLLRKLAAFNQLVKLAKFRQAAIVYNDIKRSIEKFDPRIYLPSLFGEYFSNIVAHAQSLTTNLGTPEDFTAKALDELYHVDIDRFIEAKGS
jgi:hypothetical protein